VRPDWARWEHSLGRFQFYALADLWICCGDDVLQLLSLNEHRKQPFPRPTELPYRLFRLHHEEAMRKLWKKFVWTPKFWAVLGILGCISGAYFQRVASNGCGLWCLGLVFLGAAYLEKHEYWPG
jgi:hypothetical protein